MTHDPHNSDSQSSDAVEQLVRAAGRREPPSADLYERTLQVATQAWETKVRRGRMRRLSIAAASAMLAIMIGWQIMTSNSPPTPVARIEGFSGLVSMRMEDEDSTWSNITESTPLLAESTSLRTDSQSRVRLALGSAYSLHLAENSEVKLLSQARLQLISGKLYLASLDPDAPSATVITASGQVTDIGTQFEVRHVAPRLRVRVRAGSVLVQRDAHEIQAAAGEEITVSADGSVQRARFATDHPDWDWTENWSTHMSMDGQPLTSLLERLERETGRRVRYANSDIERRAAATILHGRLESLLPMDALTVALSTTDLRHRSLPDGTILIELK
jgi:ferric-dicitrate binding protein FerR (iron transport regulator)